MNEDAVTLLDNAIAVVTEHGFNAETYHGMSSCYIGLCRRMAGLRAEPLVVDATCEPGTPLAEVLTAVDAAAIAHRAAHPDPRMQAPPRKSHSQAPGRAAESYGLLLVRYGVIGHGQQAPIALEVLRAARDSLLNEPHGRTQAVAAPCEPVNWQADVHRSAVYVSIVLNTLSVPTTGTAMGHERTPRPLIPA